MEDKQNDSLQVEINDDGTMKVSWDKNDPKYQLFNGLTDKQLEEFILESLTEMLSNE